METATKKDTLTLCYPDAYLLMESVVERFSRLHPEEDVEPIWSAFYLAQEAHKNQLRMSGVPYILHPVEVAEIAVEMRMDRASVIAALLHDVVEDTPVRLSRIERLFGREVAELVDGLTKIERSGLFSRLRSPDPEDNRLLTFQKLFSAMSQDNRVMILKLADRLANMRTLHHLPPERAKRFAQETEEIYVPISRRMGLYHLTVMLEDLCFKHLRSDEYRKLSALIDPIRFEGQAVLERVRNEVQQALQRAGVRLFEVSHRIKHLRSIWEKMQRKNVDLTDIYDILALRVVIEGEPIECYRALGIIHQLYQPIFHRFRDFIARPKDNGYRALHTTVFVGKPEEQNVTPEEVARGDGNFPLTNRVEIQIRTVPMHFLAEYGVAAHWAYKELVEQDLDLSQELSWLEVIQSLRKEAESAKEFMRDTRAEVLSDRIVVLTPKGETISLPRGSTPVDFAYAIHTELGHACRKARVNGQEVPLDYPLDNGDVVTIIKSTEKNPAPDPAWLSFAKSPRTVLAIRRWMRRIPYKERIELGRKILREAVIREGLYPLNLLTNDRLLRVIREFKLRRLTDLFERIAMGHLSTHEVVERLKRLADQETRQQERVSAHLAGSLSVTVRRGRELGLSYLDGEPLNVRTTLMDCCLPIPGDEIFGVSDLGERRIFVHRRGCPKLASSRERAEPLSWHPHEGLHLPVAINVSSLNRVGLLYEILSELSRKRINFISGDFRVSPTAAGDSPLAHFQLVVEVTGVEELNELIRAISEIDDVLRVERAMGAGAVSQEGKESQA